FSGYSIQGEELCRIGKEQLKFLVPYIDYAWADSEYNRLELEELGYKNTHVTPIIINFEDYKRNPSQKLMEKFKAEKHITNILFVGRIAPNKKQEDIIKVFYYYKKYINEDSRLFLVGSYSGMERYYNELMELVKELQLEDVYITGHISFEEILAYYTNADLFLCMSEHEGFCVPLVEAMHFEIPIIAYKSSAIGETLGNGGILVLEKQYKEIAELMHIVLSTPKIKERMIINQKKRLEFFSKKNTENIFRERI
ncbi:glycosyltransferase, partial [Aneurinibacillus thermoaerophilus]|uniref:glycosyltransferase n=1 Tax=Aneurinibacillus thermoaerophilus TaxID=143495 RepID=UPI002E1F9255